MVTKKQKKEKKKGRGQPNGGGTHVNASRFEIQATRMADLI